MRLPIPADVLLVSTVTDATCEALLQKLSTIPNNSSNPIHLPPAVVLLNLCIYRQFCRTSRIPCNVTASHWCLIFYRISLNLFDVSFYFISWHHELSAALGALQLKVHSRSDDMHGIASARVRLFHSQNISRTNIHVPFHPFHLTCSQINHEYILLYPIFLHKAIFSRDIFCICTKAIKDTAQIQ